MDVARATFYFDLLVSRAVHAPQSRRITIVRAIAPRKCHNPSCSIDLEVGVLYTYVFPDQRIYERIRSNLGA